MNTKEISENHYIDAKIEVLATKVSRLHLTDNGKLIESIENTGKSDLYKSIPKAIYITCYEELKEGDYSIFDGKVVKVGFESDILVSLEFLNGARIAVHKDNLEVKIIATTDSSLCYTKQNGHLGQAIILLPQPSKEFIQSFIESYNKGEVITDVLVEVECGQCKEYGYVDSCKNSCNGKFIQLKLKDNTIIIKKKEIKTMIIDEEKLNSVILKLEEKRDEYFKSSADYIEKDEIINAILSTITKCTIS